MTMPILLLGEIDYHGAWAGTMPAPQPRPEPWQSVNDDPPLNVEIDIRVLGNIVTGFAHRRLLGGKLTFWSWIDGRCRIVCATAWRRKA